MSPESVPSPPAAQAQVVMISGANRGIGRAVAERLHADGHRLSLGARDPVSLEPLSVSLGAERLFCHRYDARDVNDARAWVGATVARYGRVDAVVCNAGVFHGLDMESDDEAALDAMWEVNAKGPLRLVRAAWATLKAGGRGRVVMIASLSGLRVKSPSAAGYAMSKHAAVALTHGIRHAGWAHGIRATAICPGYVATDMSRGATGIAEGDKTGPESVAHLVASVLALPNNASVAVLPVNCVLESDL